MIVLDASVAVKPYLEERGAEEATELLAGPEKLLAPELIRLEVAGALCRRVRNKELDADDAEIEQDVEAAKEVLAEEKEPASAE